MERTLSDDDESYISDDDESYISDDDESYISDDDESYISGDEPYVFTGFIHECIKGNYEYIKLHIDNEEIYDIYHGFRQICKNNHIESADLFINKVALTKDMGDELNNYIWECTSIEFLKILFNPLQSRIHF